MFRSTCPCRRSRRETSKFPDVAPDRDTSGHLWALVACAQRDQANQPSRPLAQDVCEHYQHLLSGGKGYLFYVLSATVAEDLSNENESCSQPRSRHHALAVQQCHTIEDDPESGGMQQVPRTFLKSVPQAGSPHTPGQASEEWHKVPAVVSVPDGPRCPGKADPVLQS